MMLVRLFRAALALACTVGVQAAWADIYTWVDSSGTVNISNIAPPEDVKVIKVMHESPPRPATEADVARQAEVQALAARVRQLEWEAEFSRRQMPPPVDYTAMAPPPMQYAAMAPPPMQYFADAPQQSGYSDCDPAWGQCGTWWNAPYYPVAVVVVRPPGFRRPSPFHGGHRVGMQTAVRAPGGSPRR